VYVHEPASLGDDSADKLEAMLRTISNKSATSGTQAPAQVVETTSGSVAKALE
jgi:hypothetical protein